MDNKYCGSIIEAMVLFIEKEKKLHGTYRDLFDKIDSVFDIHYKKETKFYDMNIRDTLITGTFLIGEDGQKEPTNWKEYAEKLEKHLEQTHLLKELEKFIDKYEFSFQFWGQDNNNVFINKDDVEIASFGGENSITDILRTTLEYLYRINRTPQKDRAF